MTGPRLQLDSSQTPGTVLDGGWWPHSTNPATELRAVVDAMGDTHGTVTHMLLNPADWDLPHPRRISAAGGPVRVGWFTSQPTGLLTMICDFNRDRIDLLVVPPTTTSETATEAMTAAAAADDGRRVPALLADLRASA